MRTIDMQQEAHATNATVGGCTPGEDGCHGKRRVPILRVVLLPQPQHPISLGEGLVVGEYPPAASLKVCVLSLSVRPTNQPMRVPCIIPVVSLV